MDVSHLLQANTYKRVNSKYVAENRAIGAIWERKFCEMAGMFGRSFTAHQIGRNDSAQIISYNGGRWNSFTAPDVTVWSYPGEHHEIKHKDPTIRKDTFVFGLEEYRLNALVWFANETKQAVQYTIHNYGLQHTDDKLTRSQRRSHQKHNQHNTIEHWFTANVLLLRQTVFHRERDESICNGKSIDTTILYWPIGIFTNLFYFWTNNSTDTTPQQKQVDAINPLLYVQAELFGVD